MVRLVDEVLWDVVMLAERSEGPGGSVQIRSLGFGGLGFTLDDPLSPTDTIPLGPWTPEGLTRVVGSESLTQVPPLGAQRLMAFGPDGLWTGVSTEYSLHKVVPSGDTVLTVRRLVAPIPLRDEDAARIENWYEANIAEGFEGDQSVLPSAYPFFGALTTDDRGKLWVFRDSGTPGVTLIDLFDPTGAYEGTVSVDTPIDLGPGGLIPRVVNDYLVVSSADEYGVQYVEVFAVEGSG